MDKKAVSAVLWLILLMVNICSVFIGYIYYQQQLSTTPWYLWVFVPDCPFYVLLFILAFGRVIRSDTFNFIVSIGMMKYALWTLFVLLYFNSTFFMPPIDTQSTFLFIAHIGMFLEFLLIIPKKIDIRMLGLALGWFLLNDVIDYFGPAVHPHLPGDITIIMVLTFAASIFLTLGAYALGGKIAKHGAVLKLRAVFGVS